MLQLGLGLGLGLGPGNGIFPFLFTCNVHSIRTTTVPDVTMMYSKERYMENVPQLSTMYNQLTYYVLILIVN